MSITIKTVKIMAIIHVTALSFGVKEQTGIEKNKTPNKSVIAESRTQFNFVLYLNSVPICFFNKRKGFPKDNSFNK